MKRTSRIYRAPSTLHDFQEKDRQPVQLQTADIANLQFIPVQSTKDALLWRTLIEKYHYIKATRLFGSQVRYLVYGDPHLSDTLSIVKQIHPETGIHWGAKYRKIERGQYLLGAMGFVSAAWRLAGRDQFIGWTDAERNANLKRIVNNVRFLILPWIHSKYLASRILGAIARQLPFDWEARYAYRPALLETFVQTDRFKGTCYKAANWIRTGQTKGYSLSSVYKKDVSTKDIYVYPLCRNFRDILSDRE